MLWQVISAGLVGTNLPFHELLVICFLKHGTHPCSMACLEQKGIFCRRTEKAAGFSPIPMCYGEQLYKVLHPRVLNLAQSLKSSCKKLLPLRVFDKACDQHRIETGKI